MQALIDVSIAVYRGEILAIIGPNGAGKTSLLNVINGVYRPQGGRIMFLGQERARHMRPYQVARQGIARTFQNVALFKGMSTLDNIMTGRVLHMRRGLLLQALYGDPPGVKKKPSAPRWKKSSIFWKSKPFVKRRWDGCRMAYRSASSWGGR